MKSLFCFITVSLLCSVSSLTAADMVFGGRARFDSSLLLDEEKIARSIPDLTASFYPSLSVTGIQFDFAFTGVVSYTTTSREPALEVEQCELSLNPSDSITVKLGRFQYLPGTAEFISPTNYFSRIDYEKLFTGAVAEAAYIVPNDLVQAGLFLSSFHLKLTLAPFAGDFIMPETTSVWFPRKDIPESIHVSVPFDQTMYLKNLYYGDPDYLPETLESIALSAEAGITVWRIDALLIYYHGTDNTPLVRGELFFPEGLFKNYDVIVYPRYRLIDALGLNLAASISSFRFWLDSSYTFLKTFNTNRLSSTNLSTELASSPYMEYSIGLSYELYFKPFNFIILGEYRDSTIFDREDYFIDIMLSSLVLGMLRLRFFVDSLAPSFTIINSLLDGSTAFIVQIQYRPSDELELNIQSPIIFGKKESDFGQYRENHLISMAVTWKF